MYYVYVYIYTFNLMMTFGLPTSNGRWVSRTKVDARPSLPSKVGAYRPASALGCVALGPRPLVA